jgi:two-component system, chemotaxis family, CheB/CheR fusion protein
MDCPMTFGVGCARVQGVAFVVILHLPADRKSPLTEILRRWTSMRVLDVTDDIRIEPNCVYVPPPRTVVTLLDGHLSVEPNAVAAALYTGK